MRFLIDVSPRQANDSKISLIILGIKFRCGEWIVKIIRGMLMATVEVKKSQSEIALLLCPDA